MGLEPISVELTDFAKLELLRDEEERLTEELAEVERSIRAAMIDRTRREFLMSLSPYYAAQAQEGPDVAKLKELDSRRQLVYGALTVVSTQKQQLEEALGAPEKGTGARRSPRAKPPGSKSSSFDSFEDYRQSRG
jgi:hypothetical protein